MGPLPQPGLPPALPVSLTLFNNPGQLTEQMVAAIASFVSYIKTFPQRSFLFRQASSRPRFIHACSP